MLQCVFEGDLVDFEGRQYSVTALHEDRTASLSPGARRVLLRDCSLIRPEGAFCQKKIRRRQNLELLSCEDHCRVDASGRGSINGSRVGQLDREGCHYLLPMAVSQPVPEGLLVNSLHLSATGMDQGWGNTGDSGLFVYLRRVEGGQVDEPLLGITYDRRRSLSLEHRASSELLRGPFAPQAGDRFLVLLRCPNYPAWSAYCKRLQLAVDCQEQVEEKLPWSLTDQWRGEQERAFFRLWAALAEDEYLSLDMSHLSLAGQRLQHVWKPLGSDANCGASLRPELLPRLKSLLASTKLVPAPRVKDAAEKLLAKLQRNETAVGAPAQAQERSARYAELASVVHRTFDALEGENKGELLAAVLQQYADCVEDCIYRWEREIHNMHDLVTGETSGEGALDAEDEVLRVLYRKRRQMAESVLHHSKGANETADMHFESHFYASLHFGLAEQLTARRDPHRLTYLQLESRVRPDALQAKLFKDYVPARLRQTIREEVFESQSSGTQALREKITNWFSANIPVGFRANDTVEQRREAFLYQFCYDEEYRITDEALNYMLCCMHILTARSLILQASGQSLSEPEQYPPASFGRFSSESSERSVRARCTMS